MDADEITFALVQKWVNPDNKIIATQAFYDALAEVLRTACLEGQQSARAEMATVTATSVESVQSIEPATFEVRLLIEDTSTVTIRMDGPTLCSLADKVSQYATP